MKSWHVEPGHASEPETLFLGGTPGALFRSDDGGATWEPVNGVIEHPTRERWKPGAGGLCCHSIQLDPSDPNRLYVAISAAGAFRTDDGGESWTPMNTSVAADFLSDARTPRSATACTSCSSTRRTRSGSGSRTTAASTAPTTAATPGSGSTATAYPRTSASRSLSTPPIRTSPT